MTQILTYLFQETNKPLQNQNTSIETGEGTDFGLDTHVS